MAFVGTDISGLPSIKQCSWSHFQNIIAVIPSDGSVHFYSDNGNESSFPAISRNAQATAIEWCPNCDVLAIGWNDGFVTVWNNGKVQNSSQSLKASINLLSWHSTIPIFLSAAENGNVIAWDGSSAPRQIYMAKGKNPFAKAAWIHKEMLYAFLADIDGHLFGFENNTSGNLVEICDCPVPIHSLTIMPATNKLLIISGENILSQYSLPPSISKQSQVKLNVGDVPTLIKLKPDTICYAIGNTINISNVNSDDTQILRTPNEENVTSLYFDAIDAVLYATTALGHIISFRCTMKGINMKAGWAAPVIKDLGSKVESALWSQSCTSFVATANGRRPLIFRHVLTRTLSNKEVTVWMSDPKTLVSGNGRSIKSNQVIESISSSGSHVLVSTATQNSIYAVRNSELTPFRDNITTNTPFTTIYNESTYEVTGQSLLIRNLQGVVKQTISLGTTAKVTHFVANGAYLCIITDDLCIFLFKTLRRQPDLQFSTMFWADYDTFRIRDVSVSCGGFCISLTIDIFEDDTWKPAPDLYLHSPQFDKTVSIPFDGKVPKEHSWDNEDPRLLCVQVVPYSNTFESKLTGSQVFPLFVADSLEVFRQTPLTVDDSRHLCGVDLPNVLMTDYSSAPGYSVLPQFEGLDNVDEESKKALMELNFHLATGDIDAAFNAIRGINNKRTWRSLAQTCAQMRRIDLADLCFGKMEDGGSAILLHQARTKGESDVDAMVVVDTQLGIYNEAKDVAKANRRFDLLAKVSQSQGDFPEALKIATTSDRIHKRSIAYQYARSLEIHGEMDEAVKKYEKSGTLGDELPRLAVQSDDFKLIFNYVEERNVSDVPKQILLWLARFFEAHNQVELSLRYYEYAGASTEYVRLLCINGQWEEASKYVKKSRQRSVICQYARLLMRKVDYLTEKNEMEQADKLKHEVIEQFRRARQFGQAMAYALDKEMVDDILSLSFSAPQTTVCKAAQWFESQKEIKNAILLYSRAGRLNRALTLCFKNKQYDALDEISDSLTAKTDSSVLIRCGKYFVESERWSRAAQCYALAQQFDIVIELCNQHNIKISQNVIQQLSENASSDEEVLKRFAALCEQQRDFTTASKLYLKLKDYLASIKVLIRAGDTQKVVKFAKTFRRREGYILAANYLQTLSTHDNPQVFETIVDFYNRAGAPDKLARFYESAAQVEIDEYQNYSKGLELIQKSIEVLDVTEGMKNKETIMKSLVMKTKLISLYIQATQLVQTDSKKAIAICVELLRTKEIETCLRSDDVYILMVQCYVAQGNFKNAYKILEDLRGSGTDITWFLDINEIDKIYNAAGQKYDGPRGDQHGNDYDDIDDADIDDIGA